VIKAPPITPTRPVSRWHGGKWKLASWIIAHFPPHRVYVETHGGMGSCLLKKERVYEEVYNDIDGELVNLFRMVRDRGEELVRACELTPYAREEFRQAQHIDGEPLERARRILVRMAQGFGGLNLTRSTGFRGFSRRTGQTPARDWRNYPPALVLIIERLRGVTIENMSAIALIHRHDGPETLFYVDPPYDFEKRNIRHRYRFDMDENDQRALAEVLNQVRGHVVLSGYDCKLYRELYPPPANGGAGWQRFDKATYADGARARRESLWIKIRNPKSK
jgi:DNA adenine methylase